MNTTDKTQHTPGPWQDTDRNDFPKSMDAYVKIDAERQGIAYVYGDTKTEREAMTTNKEAVTGERIPARRWTYLLKSARLVQAHSHYDEAANEYHVDPHAMAHLCAAIGNRKFEGLGFENFTKSERLAK